jgi:hypothetical protein
MPRSAVYKDCSAWNSANPETRNDDPSALLPKDSGMAVTDIGTRPLCALRAFRVDVVINAAPFAKYVTRLDPPPTVPSGSGVPVDGGHPGPSLSGVGVPVSSEGGGLGSLSVGFP